MDSNMADEISLQNKISMLQAEMLNFHKKISPVRNRNPIDGNVLSYPEENTVLSTCIHISLSILKIFVCITGPTIFPTVVYCIEGSSQLFWQVTGISCVVALAFVMMTASKSCFNTRKIQGRLTDKLHSLNDLLSKTEFFRYISEILTSDFVKKNIHKILYPVIILFATSLICFAGYLKQISFLFYGSLMLISFISGILSTIIYNLLQSPELLPFHSPHKIKMEFTTPSPQTRKECDFSTFRKKESRLASQFSALPVYPLTDRNVEFTETQSITAFIPNLSPNSYKEAMERSQELRLPLNLNYFFRKL